MADMRGSRYFKIVNSLAIILPRHGPLHPYEILRSLPEEVTHLFVYFNQLMQFPDKPHISLKLIFLSLSSASGRLIVITLRYFMATK